MALIRNTAAMRLRGRVGNTTYYTEGGRQIARVSQNSSNYGETARRTEQQQSQRAKWANLVNFYKASRSWMPKAFENKKRTQSDYNRFMQLNVAAASVYLTKEMYAAGGCVVEPYKITEGSLRSINLDYTEGVWSTDIALGELTITDETSVSEFSQAVIAANAHMREGMQISFISYQQDINANNVPQLICTAYEVTLQVNNPLPLRNFLPVFCSSVLDGYLATNADISTGCFAYVLSDSTSGRTLVSTQTLINNNQILINQYSTAAAISASIASYGVDGDVFLMSGSAAQNAAAGTLYLASILRNSDNANYPVGTNAKKVSDIVDTSTGKAYIVMSSNIVATTAQVSAVFSVQQEYGSRPTEYTATIVSVNGKLIQIGLPSAAYNNYLTKVLVTINGEQHEGNWTFGIVEHE